MRRPGCDSAWGLSAGQGSVPVPIFRAAHGAVQVSRVRFDVVQVWSAPERAVVILYDNEERCYCVAWDGPLNAGWREVPDVSGATEAWFHAMEQVA